MKSTLTYDARLAEFKEMISKTEYLKYTLNSLIYWDKITHMPPEGIEYRTKVMSFLADEQYRLMSGSKFTGHVKYFKNNKKNDQITDSMVRRIYRSSEYVNKVPEAEYRRYIELIAMSEQVWEQAKTDNDFELFKPYLKEIFDTFRRFAQYWGPADDPYDALLNYYEKGLTVDKVDGIVSELKPFLIDMLEKIRSGKNFSERKPLHMPTVDAKRQQEIWKAVLSDMGFRFEAGRVDIGSHPTILANSPSDVRIVNSYREDDLRSGLFNVLHSGGKGIYQQSISKDLLGTFLAEAPSFAMEESIGRFYENLLGRSMGFWSYFYDKICAIAPEIGRFTLRQIYEDVNMAAPSLIRIEADQMTYLLHIIIRYELERELINDRLTVDELPQAWNRKYEDYLGVRPANDSEGVLQDIHWAAGYVGYFPAYFVSNLAAAQISAAMEEECGDLNDLMSKGKFDVINRWLKEKIFCYGAVFDTEELVERATGKPLDSKDYISYLREKFSEVYKSDAKL